MSVGAYGFLIVSTGVCGQMLVSEGAKWCQMVSVVAYGFLIVSEGVFCFLSGLLLCKGTYWCLWSSTSI